LEILTVHCTCGSVHDFDLFKNTIGYAISPNIELLCDKGYQGILRFHPNSSLPKKKPRKGDLEPADKKINRGISGRRLDVEHINAKLKVFKILSTPYRNRRKAFGLRMNLLSGIVNFERI
jgi:transposase